MNRGKSSNCVHWLQAVLTGTFTKIDFSTFVVIDAPPQMQSDPDFSGTRPELVYVVNLTPWRLCI
jgi:hypothetical protein